MTTGLVPGTRELPGLRWSARRFVGCCYLLTAGIHVGIVAADSGFYRGIADGAALGWVRQGWHSIFMAHPAGVARPVASHSQ